ncbi:MAG: hypothetical protein ACI9WU_004668 [Myxococcota bacterium]|jgi:hypothetical protein
MRPQSRGLVRLAGGIQLEMLWLGPVALLPGRVRLVQPVRRLHRVRLLMSARLVAVVTLLSLVLWTSPADAQSRAKRATAHYHNGLAAMKEARHDDAIAEFTAALELRPAVEIYYALGLANERSGRSIEAKVFYEKVLAFAQKRKRRVRPEVLRRTRGALERLAAEKPAPARTVTAVVLGTDAPDAKAWLGDQLLGPADGSTALSVPPGELQLRVTASGRTAQFLHVTIRPGETRTLHVTYPAEPVAAGLTPLRIGGISAASVAGVALIAGIALTVSAAGTRDDLVRAAAGGGVVQADSKADVEAWADRVDTASYAMFALAGAGAITALTLFLLPDTDGAVSAQILPSPQGVHASMRLTF